MLRYLSCLSIELLGIASLGIILSRQRTRTARMRTDKRESQGSLIFL